MDKLRIRGGRPLEGEVRVSGAKNAALPIMCAALLTDQPLRLSNVPHLMDTRTMAKLLRQMGVAAIIRFSVPVTVTMSITSRAPCKRSTDACM